MLGRVWPDLAPFAPKLGPETTFRQLRGKFGEPSGLAGIAKGSASGRVASNCLATFEQLASVACLSRAADITNVAGIGMSAMSEPCASIVRRNDKT